MFVFGIYQVQISSELPVVLNEVVRCFLQYLQTDVEFLHLSMIASFQILPYSSVSHSPHTR
jgi:hypothetical protein